MRKTAILVGAGATLAEALPSQPARKSRPPLDATFFELCKLQYLEGRGPLHRYLSQQYGINPYRGFRMEEVFNVVYADAVSEEPPGGCLEAYWALIKMYRDAIRTTTNRLKGTSGAGVGALLRFLLSLEEKRDITFITFNQDLVIEKAIESAASVKKYAALPWNIRTAYGMEFSGFAVIAKHPVFRSLGDSPSTSVLKLHGSMNWLHKVRSANDAKNSVRQAQGDLFCCVNRDVFRSLTFTGGKRTVPTVPLIVPPVYEKSQHTRARLGPIWAEAHSVLSTADELIVFGYSFPDSDIAARNALRRSFHRNTKVEHVHVIDTAPDSAARVGGMVRASVTTRYRNVTSFKRFFPEN